MAIQFKGMTCTTRTWALKQILHDLPRLFDFYYVRNPKEWNQMTEKEQREVKAYYQKFCQQTQDMLWKELGNKL